MNPTNQMNSMMNQEAQKIDYLKNVVNDKCFESQTEMVESFNTWLSIASKAKCRRNNYVHGRWRTHLIGGTDKWIIFEPQSNNKTETFSLNEFKAIVLDMKNLGIDFHTLREKYLRKYEVGRLLPG